MDADKIIVYPVILSKTLTADTYTYGTSGTSFADYADLVNHEETKEHEEAL